VNFSDVLHSLIAPVTVKAIRAGAEALDERTRLLATIAGLETTVREQARQIEALRGTPPEPLI
jgi:hypothetical protein